MIGNNASLFDYDLTSLSEGMAGKNCFYILTFWIVLEILFAIIVYWVVLPILQKLKQPVPYHGNIVDMMKKTFEEVKNLKSYNFEMYVSGFCNGAKFEDIHIDNFRSFLAWGMLHKHLHDVTEQEEQDIADVVDYVGKLHPELYQLKPGHNPAVTNCSMTLEPLPIIHRPLIMYITVSLFETLANAVFLRACGFQSMEVKGTHYWYKSQGNYDSTMKNKTCSDGLEPMVFLHGISTGWMLYMNIVKAIGTSRTLILVDVDAIKVKSLNFDMPTPEQFVKSVCRILDRHSIHQASFVGHSFGSVTAGWFVRYFPEKVSHLTLIDPVTLLLSFPEVAYSFLYREPTTLIEWVIYLAAARELTVCHALRRHFWWYNNALWLEDIPAHIGVVVGVSSKDEIINAAAVYEYCSNCRQQRLSARREASSSTVSTMGPSTTFGYASRRLTRSTSNLLHSSSDILQEDINTPIVSSSSISSNNIKPPIAMIECILWEGYSHGQILLPTEAQRQFVKMVRCNEKIGSVY